MQLLSDYEEYRRSLEERRVFTNRRMRFSIIQRKETKWQIRMHTLNLVWMLEAGYEVVEQIKNMWLVRTCRGLWKFGGMFDLSKTGVKEPVWSQSTDGVIAKLMLAIKYDKHDTIGQDCVAMCQWHHRCRPSISLTMARLARMNQPKLEQVVAGVAEGCVQAGAALISGETFEMPGMYGEDGMTAGLQSVWLKNLKLLIFQK